MARPKKIKTIVGVGCSCDRFISCPIVDIAVNLCPNSPDNGVTGVSVVNFQHSHCHSRLLHVSSDSRFGLLLQRFSGQIDIYGNQKAVNQKAVVIHIPFKLPKAFL